MDIRKISVGPDYKNGAMHYIVGQEVLNGTNKIYLFKEDIVEKTVKVYIINEKKEVTLWKKFPPTVPISIEYNINF